MVPTRVVPLAVVPPPSRPCMNATIESPALRVFVMILLTEPLAAVGAEMIQNNTNMITTKPASLGIFTGNPRSRARGHGRPEAGLVCTAHRGV